VSPLVETTNPSVWISGNAGLVEVVVVRRKRKRLALVVETDGEVQCRIPSRCAQRTAETFIFAHQDWILRTIARMKDRVGRPRPQYAEGAAHYFLGQRYQLETCQNLQSKAQVRNSALLVRAASDDPTFKNGLRIGIAPKQTSFLINDCRPWLNASACRWRPV